MAIGCGGTYMCTVCVGMGCSAVEMSKLVQMSAEAGYKDSE